MLKYRKICLALTIIFSDYCVPIKCPYRVPELGYRYSCGTQISSFVSYLLRDFFLENIDSKDKIFKSILNKNVTEYEKRWGTIPNSGTLYVTWREILSFWV